MELTIDEALQQGIAAHKLGKLQDAESLYRAILQSQPVHPDANHNLGLIAVSMNKPEGSLPLFKTALEANPKIEQFWLSYIDALVKANQLDNAKHVFKKATEQGIDRDKLSFLEAQLIPRHKPKFAFNVNPSQQKLSSLLEHYQNGRFGDAEKLARSVTQEFPQHDFAWKVLGSVFAQTGRKSEAVAAYQKTIALSPRDAEAHNNLANTLKELGRLVEAEASYSKAIALQPDFAEAYNNLGVTLQKLARLDGAEASFNQAIALQPNLAEAHSNLGDILKELGRLAEAEASFNQAITLKPDLAEAYSNLAITLKELDRLDEAEANYTQAIDLKPDFALAHYGLGVVCYIKGNEDLALKSIVKANEIEPQSKDFELMLRVMEVKKRREGNESAKSNANNKSDSTGLISSPIILSRAVEPELIASLYQMNFIQLDKTKRDGLLASGKTDARYGNGIVSPDFSLFEDARYIIRKIAADLTEIMIDSVKSDIYIFDSFFNIFKRGGGTISHNHLTNIDKDIELGLGERKYSLVYYLNVGDQSCRDPGILKLYEPEEEILPCAGMIAIFPASRMHSSIYGGEIDRVMIGANFYSL